MPLTITCNKKELPMQSSSSTKRLILFLSDFENTSKSDMIFQVKSTSFLICPSESLKMTEKSRENPFF